MILSQEQWMNLRVFKALAEAGATWAEIARETGHDWRTVKRYLCADAPAVPPAPARRGPGRRKTDPYAHLIDAWLRRQPKLKASVIWERLVAEHGFTGHYQRVKVYVREHRARLIDAEPAPVGFHRRFEVLPGAQAQVDWGDEGELQTQAGPLHAYSFHMTLSYSRDPFCCYTASQDLGTFWDCHRRASQPRPGRAAPPPKAPLHGVRPAPPPGRQGRPGLLRGQPLLGALAAGPTRRPGGAPRHPGRGRGLVAGAPAAAAGHPPPRLATRRLGR